MYIVCKVVVLSFLIVITIIIMLDALYWRLGQQGSRFVKYIDLCHTAAVLIGEHRYHNQSLDFVLVIWPEVSCARE